MIQEVERSYCFILDPLPQQAVEFNKVHAFYDHLRGGRLTTTTCTSCGTTAWPPRSVCPSCFCDDLKWVDLPTVARIVAYTVQEAGAPPGFTLPMVFALLEFTSEIRFIGRVLTDAVSSLEVGQKVSLEVVEVPQNRVMPAFKPID